VISKVWLSNPWIAVLKTSARNFDFAIDLVLIPLFVEWFEFCLVARGVDLQDARCKAPSMQADYGGV
jgi:hypothetical protein